MELKSLNIEVKVETNYAARIKEQKAARLALHL